MKTTTFVFGILLVSTSFCMNLQAASIMSDIADPRCMCSRYKSYMMRIQQANGQIEPSLYKNLAKLQSVCGDIRMFSGYSHLCTECDPRAQARAIADVVKTAKFQMNYVVVYGNNWNADIKVNRKFFAEFLDEYSKCSLPLGIGTEENDWNRIMGPDCTEHSRYPLWHLYYDNDPNLTNFKPFGGWYANRVFAKRYASLNTCNNLIDVNSQYLGGFE